MTLFKMSSFVQNVAKIITGDIVVKIIGFLAIAVIARLYPPEDFGILELAVSIQLIALTFSSMKYEQAIPLPEKDEDAISLLSLSLLILLIFTIATCIITYIVYRYWQDNEIVKKMGVLIFFIPGLILFRGIRDDVSFWFTRKKRFGRSAISDIGNKIGEISGKIILFGLGVTGLFLGNIIGIILSILIYLVYIYSLDREIIKRITYSGMREKIKEYKKFPIFLLPSHLFKMVSERLPAIILTPFFGFTIVGFYAMSFKLFNEPMSILSKSIANVFYQEASVKHARDDNLGNLVGAVFEKLVVLMLLPITFLAIGGDVLFSVFLGKNWIVAGQYTQILAPMMFFRFISTPIAMVLNVLGKQDLDMIFNGVFLVFCIAALSIGIIINDIILTLSLFSFANSVMYVVLIILILKLCKLSFVSIMKNINHYVLFSVPFIIVFIYLKKVLELNNLLYITVCSCLGVLYYVIVFMGYKKSGKSLL